jgi:hypothetical protein
MLPSVFNYCFRKARLTLGITPKTRNTRKEPIVRFKRSKFFIKKTIEKIAPTP